MEHRFALIFFNINGDCVGLIPQAEVWSPSITLPSLMVIGPPFQAMHPLFFMKSDLVSGLLSLRPPGWW